MSAVRLEFLGSGDAFGGGGRLQTCMRLFGAEDDLLIDCGTSTLIAMRRAGVDPAQIGWVVLSHLHGDHFAGLPFMILDAQFGGRTRPLVIAGPQGTASRLRETMEALFPGSTRVERKFDTHIVELVEGHESEVGPARVTPFRAQHASGAPSFVLRIAYGGKVIAYSGDTAWTDTLLEASHEADLFVCEAYFFEKRIPYHMDYATLFGKRDQLECRRIVLTHMSEDMLGYAGDVDLETADDGVVIEV